MYQQIKNAVSQVVRAYDPGVKVGKIETPYAVVHDMGTAPQEGTRGMLGQHIYEVVVLAPLGQQDALAPLAHQIRTQLRALPGLRYTGDAKPTGIEETYVGVSMSLIYRVPVRIQ